jgi:uracil phosphoribosyltransferase
MRVHIADHPLITHKLTVLRDKNTPSPVFRQLVEELVTLLAYEATRDVRVDKVTVETPVTTAHGVKLSRPRPIVIPVLRAGLGMLEGMVKLLPTAEVGFLGIKRDEETLQPYTYANRLPDDLTGRQVFIIDPMLATGGTLIDSIDYVLERGATEVTCVCLLGAPEGLAAVEAHVAGVAGESGAKVAGGVKISIVLGALDEKLNELGYIVPGLGDAGDRLYGIAQ